MSQVLVTGATGFVGQYVCKELLNNGHTVYAVTRNGMCNIESERIINIKYIFGCGGDLVNCISKYTCFLDSIIHLSANINFDDHPIRILSDNVLGAQEVILLADFFNVKNLVYISSIGLYQRNKFSDLIDEKFPIKDRSFYHLSKYFGEKLFAYYKQRNPQVNLFIFRLSSPVGVGMREGTFLFSLIKQIFQEQKVVLFGHGTRIQNFVDVRDIARIIVKSTNSDKDGLYNLVSDKSYSNYEVAMLCFKSFNLPVKVNYKGVDSADKERWIFDSSKLKKHFGCACEYNLYDTIEWIKNNYEDRGF